MRENCGHSKREHQGDKDNDWPLFVDNFELAYFEDRIQRASDDGVSPEVEPRPNSPMAATEMVRLDRHRDIIAMPFVDNFLARTSEDAVAVGYPKRKAALQIADGSRFRTFTSTRAKAVDEGSWPLSVYAGSVGGQRLKFVFNC